MVDAVLRGETLVNQVANVQWFLSMYGRPGWDYEHCADELIARGYRSPGLHRLGREPAQGYQRYAESGRSNARGICASILDHLDAYYTGKIVLAGLAIDGTDHVIEGFYPRSGTWLTREDYERITRRRERGRTRPRNTAGCGFSSWPVSTHRGPGRLAAHGVPGVQGQVRYYVFQPHGWERLGIYGDPIPPLDHYDLALSIVEGFIAHRDTLRPLLAAHESTVQADQAEIAALGRRIRQTEGGRGPLQGEAPVPRRGGAPCRQRRLQADRRPAQASGQRVGGAGGLAAGGAGADPARHPARTAPGVPGGAPRPDQRDVPRAAALRRGPAHHRGRLGSVRHGPPPPQRHPAVVRHAVVP
ncbi:hypothetical protein KRR39_08400 [Nocardioides panacis]|uniref:Uncharacterized protein n=1 Tax=Nocardioides panacis TaxID=2849501 RepID=A0A975T2L6_9ACTN|nr:hypothetical protein [Nocardioides panacis]QWZ09744.1 hypothetical protein KRR39_08400 [Nocardioides panacis]